MLLAKVKNLHSTSCSHTIDVVTTCFVLSGCIDTEIFLKKIHLNANRYIFFVHFQLSIAVYLHDNPQRVTDANDVSTNETLVTHSDRHNDDIAYSTFCELFDDAYGNRDVMEICKETYWSQVKYQSFDFIFLYKYCSKRAS